MLSRIAESMYWIGRYLERADDTARVLDAHLRLPEEDPLVEPAQAGELLLQVLDCPVDEPVTEAVVMRRLCHDLACPASVVASLRGARESAARARETLPSEVWEGINTSWHGVQRGQLGTMRPTSAFRWVRDRCAVITATAETTMTRDEGWYFLVLGRSVERIDMTARIVQWAALQQGAPAWAIALRSSGAYHGYVQSGLVKGVERDSVGYLLLDRQSPRSLISTFDEGLDALAQLEDSQTRAMRSETGLVLGQVRARLEYRDRASLLDDLPERMAQVQREVATTHEAISRRYFEGAVAAQWVQGAFGTPGQES